MSLFGKVFGGGSPRTRHENSPESIDSLCEHLANTLALKAIGWPPQKLLESGYEGMSEDRLRFGLSIANEVINIWLINECIPTPHRAKQLVDLVHRAFFKLQHKKEIKIGDFIVTSAELSQIANEIDPSSTGRISNIQTVSTTWWTLMDMVYLSRQRTYYDSLQATAGSQAPDGFGPITHVAIELATHLTGTDATSGGDSFVQLTRVLEASLALYEKFVRKFLSGNRDEG